MSKTFAAWIHVTPSPTTLAESSAIFRYLNKQARISTFLRDTNTTRTQNAASDSASYYAVFKQPLHDGYMNFSVPVYHEVEDPKDADPYDIRGLRHRKPSPPPKTFSCVLQREEKPEEQEELLRSNPYHGNHIIDRDRYSPLLQILIGSGAPKWLAANLRPLSTDEQNKQYRDYENDPLYWEWLATRPTPVPMNSLMKPWREAVRKKKAEEMEKEKGS